LIVLQASKVGFHEDLDKLIEPDLGCPAELFMCLRRVADEVV
jgi:hypothetical protein